jgi:YihY family inner membrane protein
MPKASVSKEWTRRTKRLWKQANDKTEGWLHILYRAAVGFAEHEGFMSAAAIAYYAFLSLFPFSVLLLAIARRLFSRPAQAMTQYRAFLDHYLPGVNEFLQVTYAPLEGQLTLLRVIALLVLMWSGSGIFAVTGRLLDRAWRIRQKGQLWIRRRLLALPMATIALILIATLLVLSTTWNLLNRLEFLDGIGWLTRVTSLVIILFLNTLSFSLIYWSLPSAPVKWREMLPGAISASVLWEAAKFAFAVYLTNLPLFNVIYGSVAAIAAFLIWAYLSGCIVLFCGELNAEYTRRQKVTRLLEGKGSREK